MAAILTLQYFAELLYFKVLHILKTLVESQTSFKFEKISALNDFDERQNTDGHCNIILRIWRPSATPSGKLNF